MFAPLWQVFSRFFTAITIRVMLVTLPCHGTHRGIFIAVIEVLILSWMRIGIIMMSPFSWKLWILEWRDFVIMKKFTCRDLSSNYLPVIYKYYQKQKASHSKHIFSVYLKGVECSLAAGESMIYIKRKSTGVLHIKKIPTEISSLTQMSEAWYLILLSLWCILAIYFYV